MTNKLEQAARQVIANGVQGTYAKYYSVPPADFEALREALAEQAEQEPVAKRFEKMHANGDVWITTIAAAAIARNAAPVAAHEREKLAEQEQFDMDDHPPHRLCECRKCMEYFTPLPDCDAFAASGKPIAEQTNTQFMEGYRIGLAEMREKCAKVCDEWNWSSKHGSNPSGQLAVLAAAIRAIKFEGDTGFRPVSEMIAEHKQDPKKAAAIEKAKMRKAEQEPVVCVCDCGPNAWHDCDESEGCRIMKRIKNAAPQPTQKVSESVTKQEPVAWALTSENGEVLDCISHTYKVTQPCTVDYDEPLYTAPVRTKDLTDDEIWDLWESNKNETAIEFYESIIAAYKEKNK